MDKDFVISNCVYNNYSREYNINYYKFNIKLFVTEKKSKISQEFFLFLIIVIEALNYLKKKII